MNGNTRFTFTGNNTGRTSAAALALALLALLA
jgi:hypothetical protein